MKYCQILLFAFSLLLYSSVQAIEDNVPTDNEINQTLDVLNHPEDYETTPMEDVSTSQTTDFNDSVEYTFQTNNTNAILDLLKEDHSLAFTNIYEGNTISHISCGWGNIAILDYMLTNKLSLLKLNKWKQSVWHKATLSKNTACIIWLLEKALTNKELNVLSSKLDSKGNSVIYYHLLNQEENIDLLTALIITSKIYLNAINKEGFGLIHIAKSLNKQKSIEVLIKHGADSKLKNKNNQTIFDY